MSGKIVFCVDKASVSEIADHLRRCDAWFVPPLSERVKIVDYSKKIARSATCFEAWSDELIGLLAVYCNDAERRLAYITSVSVRREWQQRGIALRLLEDCLKHVRDLGFKGIELEVDADNESAKRLYASKGFNPSTVSGRPALMRLELSKDS